VRVAVKFTQFETPVNSAALVTKLMKNFSKWFFCTAIGVTATSFQVHAAQIERPMNFALKGFIQRTNLLGDFVASPFRLTTKDILLEIGIATQQDFTGGVLLWIESLDDTNAPARIVARKVLNGITNQLDVADTNGFSFFLVEPGEEAVITDRFVGATLKSSVFYAIDQFQFSTLDVTNDGRELILQGFTKETLSAYTKIVQGNTFAGFASNLSSDVNGEYRDAIGLLGPVIGKFKIGWPKYVATPVVAATQRLNMEINQQQPGTSLPPLP
jgi:hypothetical protein